MNKGIESKMELADFMGTTKMNKTRQISLKKNVADLLEIVPGDYVSYYWWNNEVFIRKGGLEKGFVYPEGFSPAKEMNVEAFIKSVDWKNYMISGKLFEDIFSKDYSTMTNVDLEDTESVIQETMARLDEIKQRIRGEWIIRATKNDPEYEDCEDIYRRKR
ncbi:MAG: hypothetical protein PHX08_16755 [Lachnospiraceae bacterium]|jgi:hypothetical protein|nr:hypothetical protein [Candidatus Cloacimonadota bacterium]MDD3140600.1 hypothetical protein [Lachnospiraceae bacterium]